MKIKTGQLRKTAPKNTEFVYPDAPMRLEVAENQSIGTMPSGAVYRQPMEQAVAPQTDARFGYILKSGDDYQGLEESREFVLRTTADFDTIIAFSEAATVILSILLVPDGDELANELRHKRLVLVSPYVPLTFKMNGFEFEAVNEELDTTIMQGLDDEVVGLDGYNLLKKNCAGFKYVQHEGGHFIPCSGAMKDWWREFFANQ